VHVSPGAQLGGNVYVGEGAHIGIGASIKPGVKIGKWSVVGAGAVVVNDVPDGVTVVGVPAKILNK
jgi:acetyltransferase EpsM